MNNTRSGKYLYSLYEKDDFIDNVNKRTEEAFNVIYHIYGKALVRYAGRYIEHQIDAEDIVNDVFLQYWISNNLFESRESLKAFLYILTRNKAINMVKRQRKLLFDVSFLDSSSFFDDFPNNSISLYIEHKSFFSTALGELPNECKKIISLLSKGLVSSEIAEKFRLAPSTVRTQKRRGIDLIRNQYLMELEKERQITEQKIKFSLEICSASMAPISSPQSSPE